MGVFKILYWLPIIGLYVDIEKPKVPPTIPIPTFRLIRQKNMMEVNWNKVESSDDKEPVIGYKVKIWEVKNVPTNVYSFVNGELIKEDREEEEPMNLFLMPTGTPTEFVTSAAETSVTYHNVKDCVSYEIRIQAYTKNYEGSISPGVRIKVLGEKCREEKK